MTNEAEVIENKLSEIADLIDSPADTWWKIGIAAIELAELYEVADCEVDWVHDLYEDVEPVDLVAALYWHYSDYSEGQASLSYRVQCALSQIYKPATGESSNWVEHSEAYHALYALLAEKEALDIKSRQGQLIR
tara:strand:- start:721 stop:1122 length:402 start_codon:yes stop_codon:yes gene_type:complete